MKRTIGYFLFGAIAFASVQAKAVTSADAARVAIRELERLVERGRVDSNYFNVDTLRVFDGTAADNGAQFSVSISPFRGWDVGVNEVRLNIAQSGSLKSYRTLPIALPREMPQWPALDPSEYFSLAFDYLRDNASLSKELAYFHRSLAVVSIRKMIEHDAQMRIVIEMQSLDYMMPLRIVYELNGTFVRHEFL